MKRLVGCAPPPVAPALRFATCTPIITLSPLLIITLSSLLNYRDSARSWHQDFASREPILSSSSRGFPRLVAWIPERLRFRVGLRMEDRIGDDDEYEELPDDHKVAIGKWFLLNAPPGQVTQVARGDFPSRFCFPVLNRNFSLFFL